MAKPIDSEHEREEKWLNEEVTFTFHNVENPGLKMDFHFGGTKEYKRYSMFDGGTYTYPRRLKEHLEGLSYPVYDWIPDGTGRLVKKKIRDEHRFMCREVAPSRSTTKVA